VRHKGYWYRWSRERGSDADRDVAAAGSGINGQMHAQLGDPAVERLPGAAWVGTPQDRVE
jgi:hypothetical protein